MAKPGRKKRTVLFIFELLILLILLGGLFVYGQINSKLSSVQSKKLDMSKVKMNKVVSTKGMTGYTNIALFGLDSRDENGSYEQNTNSDTIIIASINNDSKEVRLCSIYRDTLLMIGKDANGEDRYEKCNAAYAYGGPEQAVSMLNTNLDLNITDYVTVNFNALVTVIDLLGGLDIEMSGAEVVHMNNYCQGTSQITGKTYEPIPYPGDDKTVDTYHLNGVQATSYARIRYIGLDYQRTERQRLVIEKIVEKVKQSSLSTLSKIMDEVFPLVQTSFGKAEIFNMGAGMLSYKIGDTMGFPLWLYPVDHPTKGDCLVPTTLDYNAMLLHGLLFDDDKYTPSTTVHSYSETIKTLTGYDYDLDKHEPFRIAGADTIYASRSTPSAETAEPAYEEPAYSGTDSYDSSAAGTPDYSYTDTGSDYSGSTGGSTGGGGSDSDSDAGVDSGYDSGFDSGSDSGFDSGSDSSVDSGMDSGADETGYSGDDGAADATE